MKSYDLPFSTKVTDLHTELLRVLNNAKTVSRGNSCYKVGLATRKHDLFCTGITKAQTSLRIRAV